MAAHFLQKSRHKSVYYFRRRIPDDLWQLTGRRQIFRTLHTTDRREAMVRARVLAVETDRRFQELRMMAKTRGGIRMGYTMVAKKGDFEFSLTGEPHEGEAMDISMAKAMEKADALAKSARGRTDPSPQIAGGDATPTEAKAILLADALAAYRKSANVRATTARRYAPILQRVETAFGSTTPLTAITQSRFAEYAAAINAGSHATKTKGLYIGTAGRFFTWCCSQYDHAPRIETKTLKPRRATPARDDRGAFSVKELEVVMQAASKLKANEPHKFWITALGIFAGMRLEEMAQLDLENIQLDDASGYWFVEINGHGGRNVKTMAGWRRVPLLPALVDQGLVPYLEARRAGGDTRVFPQWPPRIDPKHGGKTYGHKISRWGGEQLERLRKEGRLATPKLTYFHSMRHALVNHLKQQCVDEHLRAAIVGHEAGGFNQNVYGKQYDVGTLGTVMVGAMTEYTAMLSTEKLVSGT